MREPKERAGDLKSSSYQEQLFSGRYCLGSGFGGEEWIHSACDGSVFFHHIGA